MALSENPESVRALIEQEHVRILAGLYGSVGESPPDPRLSARYLTLIRSIAALRPSQLVKLQLVPESLSPEVGESGQAEDAFATAQAAEDLALFRRVADASGHGFAVADARGELTYANPNLCRLYGEAEPGAVLGRPMSAYLPEEWHATLQTDIIPTVLREGCWVGELPVRSRQGQVTPAIQAIFVVHRGPEGMLRIATRVLDLSESKRMEISLRDSEERYRQLIETIHEVIFAIDTQGRISYISPAVQLLAGYRVADVLGQPVWIFLSEEDRPVLAERVRRLQAGESLGPQEYCMPLKDGSRRWVRISTLPVWREGRIHELRGTIIDIHAQKEAEIALRESEAKYAAVVEQAQIGVAIVQDGLIRYCNSYCGRLIGYAPQEIIGRSLWGLIHPEDREAQTEIHERRMQGEDAPSHYRAVGRRRDGSTIVVENSAVVIQYQGRPAALVVIRDVTYESPQPGSADAGTAG